MDSVLTLLAIDDDRENLDMMRGALSRPELEILTADDPEDGLRLFVETRPRIVLLDLVMPKLGGIEMLEKIIALDPGTDVILCTAHYSTESAVEAIQKGAADYLTKPLDIQKLRTRIDTFIADAELRKKTLRLEHELMDAYQFEGIVGRGPHMLEVYSRIRRIAPHFRTLLLTGATGTGKELVANALHRLCPARTGPFVVCNCSALVDTLVETELFGHVRGAFTGAGQDKAGMFEYAHGGTIFLDEIGELTPVAQAKLLRVLQNREVQRIGSLHPKPVDVRVIAATHRDLKVMVKEGRFREDLYYRLAMLEISLPTLSERREDLPFLERHFIRKFSAEYRKPISGLTRRAQARMAAYSWPGNVRELENAMGSACMMAAGPLIDIADLPETLRNPDPQLQTTVDDTFLSLDELERKHVLRVLDAVGGNKARAAEILGIGRATIYQMLAKLKVVHNSADAQ